MDKMNIFLYTLYTLFILLYKKFEWLISAINKTIFKK